MGTFAGVFTPSILTILGLILFLRTGYVVGAGGLMQALAIVALANVISVLTSLSLAAVATNLRVRRGGDYYLISRTLGHEFGGAIGIVLFLAQSVSIAFYAMGFGETLAAILPPGPWAQAQIIAAAAVAFLFVFAWLGSDWATRLQYAVMTVLVAALVSFFVGGIVKWDAATAAANWDMPAGGEGFWLLFALFFPAVTGFTQGVSMSGELRDPARSLPLGTFLAVGLSATVYVAAVILFGGALPHELLVADPQSMNRVSLFAPLIVAGVFAATLSSALASFLGAPRILQALAVDRIFPFLRPFAALHGKGGNPRRAVLLSAAIAFAVISLGNLNLVASVVTMFFLISYGLLNYATFFEARASSPSFRPTFRHFNTWLSLAGALACGGAMLAIEPVAALVAVALLTAIYQYLQRTAFRAHWADGQRSYHLYEIRRHLRAAAAETDHPRDWRPNILAFSAHSHRRILDFASWIEGDSGFTTLVKIIESGSERHESVRAATQQQLADEIEDSGVDAYARVIAADDFDNGLEALVQSFGIGSLYANTLLLNLSEKVGEEVRINALVAGRHLRPALAAGCNVVLLDSREAEWQALEAIPAGERRIDVWWLGTATGELTMLFAHLMTRTRDWQDATIRIIGAFGDASEEETEAELDAILQRIRINADIAVAKRCDATALARLSGDAALVFLPFQLTHDGGVTVQGEPLPNLIADLPIVALALAPRDIDLDAEIDEAVEEASNDDESNEEATAEESGADEEEQR